MRNIKEGNITKIKSSNGGDAVGHRNDRGDTQARFGVQDDPQRQDQKTGNVEDDPKEQVLFHFLSHSLSAKYKISDAKRLKVVHVCTIRAGFYF